MKKFLLCFAASVSITGIAQTSIQLKNTSNSSTVAPNSIISAVTTPSNITTITIDVKNTSSNTQSYNVKRYDIQLNATPNATASAYFCFASNCYGDNVYVSPTALTLNAGQSASQLTGSYNMLVTDMQEADAAGYSIVKYTVINTANAADSVQFTFRYNETLALNEASKSFASVDLYPNPASQNLFIKINALKPAEGKVILYNALGAVVSEKAISVSEGKNKIDLNIESLSAGIYFATVSSGNNTVTRKFVVR